MITDLADLKPYPAMKPSGVEWLGEMPEHWELRRLAQIGRLSKGNGGNKDDEVPMGVPCVRYGDLYTTHTYFIRKRWPRYHQLNVVRRLLADTRRHGAGKRYLIQHSAGSGKSNSIAWLAHQLIGLRKDAAGVFDSIIVVTDRRILDRQICDTIKQFAQVGATVGHAERSANLRTFIESGKKIIISTVQKFPFILDEIGNEQRGQRFANHH